MVFQKAGKEHTPNHKLRALRIQRNWSQQEFAEAIRAKAASMGLNLAADEKRVGRWERGEVRWPSPAYRRVLTELLGVSVEELGFRVPGQLSEAVPRLTAPTRTESENAEECDDPVRRREFVGGALAITGLGVDEETSGWVAPGPGLGLSWIGDENETPARVGLAAVEWIEALVKRFQHIDRELGGSDLCTPIARHVRRAFALLKGSCPPGLARRLHSAVAELAQLGGWLSYDAGRYRDAWRYYDMALYAAHAAENRRLVAQILGCMSLQATYVGKTREGVALARSGRDGAAGALTPREEAMLAAREARGYAKLGEETPCLRALDRAREAFAKAGQEASRTSVAFFDAAELAANAGICFLDLGRPAEAEPLLTEALALQDTDQVRNHALYLGRLASTQLLLEDLDRACATAREALAAAQQVASARSVQRLRDFQRQSTRFRDVPVVREFHEELLAVVA
ncbi:hypothetical protein C3Y87_04260 [Carbonactinospora thermoautotrophica]|uniref:helix-turn-helix domain-containing protein n=1 Tax=Carbonactinospora thermoautotrophica TaxID=1469144 RepID=UPI002270C691|nr:helix-turn-helix transcriptional regulator [Carbonactinospora thermoautotrophica]MCX9190637.1 hypothetical protein [Carbonactinospora thermoautotrophica]